MYRIYISHPSKVWKNTIYYSLLHGIISLDPLPLLPTLPQPPPPSPAAMVGRRPPGSPSSLLLPSPSLLFLCWSHDRCLLCAGRLVAGRICRAPICAASRRRRRAYSAPGRRRRPLARPGRRGPLARPGPGLLCSCCRRRLEPHGGRGRRRDGRGVRGSSC